VSFVVPDWAEVDEVSSGAVDFGDCMVRVWNDKNLGLERLARGIRASIQGA
jgi:hypothetical protein